MKLCHSPSGVTGNLILLNEMSSAPVVAQLWELPICKNLSKRKNDHRPLTQKVNLFTTRIQVTGKEPKYGCVSKFGTPKSCWKRSY